MDLDGNLYINGGTRVRKVTTDGIINSIAGNDSRFYSGDGGLATSAGLSAAGIAVDRAGNIYIADSENNRVRKLIPVPASDTSGVSSSATWP